MLINYLGAISTLKKDRRQSKWLYLMIYYISIIS